VHAPDAKRLQRCLSAVLNFAKYREDMVAEWQEMRDASRANQTRLAELTEAQAAKARGGAAARRRLHAADSARACALGAGAYETQRVCAHLRAGAPTPLPCADACPPATRRTQHAELARIASERSAAAPVRTHTHTSARIRAGTHNAPHTRFHGMLSRTPRAPFLSALFRAARCGACC
jgi:hypothetical protein